MTLRWLAVGLASVLAFAKGIADAHAQPKPPVAQVLPGSELVFTIHQTGVPVEGRFKRFGATIAFDPKRPETAEVAFTIDTASASFGAPELDLEVPKPTWLAAAQFPQATFRSTAVKPTGAGKFAVAGTLSIKGVSREVVVPVALTRSGATTTATGSFTIERLDYRVGEGEWSDTSLLAGEVDVRFMLLLGGVPPP